MEIVSVEDKRRYLQKGEILVRENEASTDAFLVIRGQIGIYLRGRPQNQIIPLGLVKPGELLGEMGIIANVKRTAEAVALTEVELLRIPRSSLEDELAKMPPWVHSMVQCLADRIVQMDNVIRSNNVIDAELMEKITGALGEVPSNFKAAV